MPRLINLRTPLLKTQAIGHWEFGPNNQSSNPTQTQKNMHLCRPTATVSSGVAKL